MGKLLDDYSGYSVSFSRQMGILLLLEPIVNDGNGTESGHVRIYENIGGTWSQIGQDIDGEAAESIVAVQYPYLQMEVQLLLEH